VCILLVSYRELVSVKISLFLICKISLPHLPASFNILTPRINSERPEALQSHV